MTQLKLSSHYQENAGFLSSSECYDYDPTKPIESEYNQKRDQIRAIAQ